MNDDDDDDDDDDHDDHDDDDDDEDDDDDDQCAGRHMLGKGGVELGFIAVLIDKDDPDRYSAHVQQREYVAMHAFQGRGAVWTHHALAGAGIYGRRR